MPAQSMSAEELKDLLAAGQPVTVVDIRTPADREWSIPGSRLSGSIDCGATPAMP